MDRPPRNNEPEGDDATATCCSTSLGACCSKVGMATVPETPTAGMSVLFLLAAPCPVLPLCFYWASQAQTFLVLHVFVCTLPGVVHLASRTRVLFLRCAPQSIKGIGDHLFKDTDGYEVRPRRCNQSIIPVSRRI